ncbi:protein MAK16 homolog, partial [Cynara cardunculus var. scolymus]|uniref:protein MAK16 homolog n=1 Tax=Cynara cardunculus var. scolymus TaxID=59895 RepID=UPI000D625BD5
MENTAAEDANAIDDDDVVVTANHEDIHPSTSAFPIVGDDDEDDDDDDEDSEPQIPDAGTDLSGDDDDGDDDDDTSIQVIPRQPVKGIFFREPTSKGEKSSENQHSSGKRKEVAEENLILILGAISHSEDVNTS